MEYRYPATLEPDEEGRFLVRFGDLPEALTDGVDLAEALFEAADCLSEALASRIVDGEEIPRPSSTEAGPKQYIISPSPTIALKAALYIALRHRDMTVADLAARLDMDWHQAARLIDPRRASKLTSLAAALAALDCQILLSVYDPDENDAHLDAQLHEYRSLGQASSPAGEAPQRPPSKRALSAAGKVLRRLRRKLTRARVRALRPGESGKNLRLRHSVCMSRGRTGYNAHKSPGGQRGGTGWVRQWRAGRPSDQRFK